MRHRKLIKKLKYPAVVVIVATVGAFFFLRYSGYNTPAPLPVKKQVGYKAEDRKRLEQIIHEEGKDD